MLVIAALHLMHERRRQVRALSACDTGKQRPQLAPVESQPVVLVLETGDEVARGRSAREKARKYARLLVGVMIRLRMIEVTQQCARGRSCLRIGAVLGKVTLEPLQRGELAPDTAVARAEHAQRVVERRRGRIAQRFGNRRHPSGHYSHDDFVPGIEKRAS